MDTAWFAVDRDGNVAVFETGEAGAAPKVAYIGEDHYGLLEELRATPPCTAAVYDLEGYRTSNSQSHVTPRGTRDVLVFLRDAETEKDRLDAIGAKAVAVSEGAGFLVPHAYPNKAFFDHIHARDLCLGCFYDYEEESDVAEHGLYRFAHAEDWISGPYALLTRPEVPVKVDDLPADLASKAIVFDGRFADAPTVQPAELWESESWGPAWLSRDGKTVRPFPGREDELDEVHPELATSEDHVLVREPLRTVVPGVLHAPRAPKVMERAPAAPYREAPGRAPAPALPSAPEKKPWWKLW